MSDRNTPENQAEEEVLFRRAVRGYNMMEVDEYISGVRDDLASLREECARLREELEAANSELEELRKKDEEAEAVYASAEEEAEKIVAEAKSRAAHIIMRTSSQCNQIAADMARQVAEQRRIYSAAKAEVFSFREKLFVMYKDHIGKINAFAEAAGASDRDALTPEEINAFFELMGDGGFDSAVSDETRGEVDRLRTVKKKKVEGASVAEKKPDPKAESAPPAKKEPERAAKVSDASRASATAKPTADVRAPEAKTPAAKAPAATAPAAKKVPAEDVWFDEYSAEPAKPAEKKPARPVRFEDEDEDFDEFEKAEDTAEPEKANDDDSEEFYSPAKEVDEYYLSDEDRDEFYSEDDDEFYPSSGGSVLTGTVGSFGLEVPMDERKARESKWKVRKSMSLTDEFDAVANEDDDD